MQGKKGYIIAIDGPSAAGKSTVGKALADRYGLVYIDTGAMYRAVAWLAQHMGIDWSDESAIIEIVKSKPIEIFVDKSLVRIIIEGKDVTGFIRNPDIGSGASQISGIPGVKRAMIERQQKMGESGGVVMEGRDIGTFVFPQADYKFYLDASLEVRGRRRSQELKDKGQAFDLTKIISSMQTRDHNDSNRAVAPLQVAPDAMFINTDNFSISQVLDIIIDRIEKG